MKKNRIFSMIMAASLLITSVTAGLAGQNNTIKAQAADPVVICIDPGHGGTGGHAGFPFPGPAGHYAITHP